MTDGHNGAQAADEAPATNGTKYSCRQKTMGVIGILLIISGVAFFIWAQFEPSLAPDEVTRERNRAGQTVKTTVKDTPMSLTAILPVLLLGFLCLTPFLDEANIAGLASWKRRTEEKLAEAEKQLNITIMNATPALLALDQARLGELAGASVQELPPAVEEETDPGDEVLALWTDQLGPAWRLRTFKPRALRRLSDETDGGTALETGPTDVRVAVERLRELGVRDLAGVAAWASRRAALLSALASTAEDIAQGRARPEATQSALASARALSAELGKVIAESS